MEALLLGALEPGEVAVRGGRLVRNGQAVTARLSFERCEPATSDRSPPGVATSPSAGIRLSGTLPKIGECGSNDEDEPKMAMEFMAPPEARLVVSRAHADRHQPALQARQQMAEGLMQRRQDALARSSVWDSRAKTYAPMPEGVLTKREDS